MKWYCNSGDTLAIFINWGSCYINTENIAIINILRNINNCTTVNNTENRISTCLYEIAHNYYAKTNRCSSTRIILGTNQGYYASKQNVQSYTMLFNGYKCTQQTMLIFDYILTYCGTTNGVKQPGLKDFMRPV
jgi:hypothetical protein